MSKINENIQIITSPQFFNVVANKHCVLDTNVFIDASNHPLEFATFFNTCRKHSITLTTISPVILEFVRGHRDVSIITEKRRFIYDIIADQNVKNTKEYIIPITEKTFDDIQFLIEKYKLDGLRTSLVDFSLGAVLKRYGENVCLITRNHKDFPLTIFNRVSYFLVEMKRSLQIYGVYQYA